MTLEAENVALRVASDAQIVQIAARVCKAILFFLEQDHATQYRPDPRFLSAASILRSASNPHTTDHNNNPHTTDPNSNPHTTDPNSSDTNTELAPIRRKAQLLLWTHRLLRALQQRTWGEGARVLLQLVGGERSAEQ